MAIFLDGTDDTLSHGDVAAFDSPTTLTWMFWGFHTGTLGNGANHEILDKGATQLYCYVASATSNNVAAGVSGSSERVTGTGVWPNSTWTHIAFTYDSGAGTRLVIYIDGTSQALTGTDPTFGDGGAAALGWSMGAALTRAAFTVANFKAYSAVLTAGEILQEMNAVRPLRTANLLIWSPYDDGTSARDYSQNGHHGTTGGGAASAHGPHVGYGAPALMVA